MYAHIITFTTLWSKELTAEEVTKPFGASSTRLRAVCMINNKNIRWANTVPPRLLLKQQQQQQLWLYLIYPLHSVRPTIFHFMCTNIQLALRQIAQQSGYNNTWKIGIFTKTNKGNQSLVKRERERGRKKQYNNNQKQTENNMSLTWGKSQKFAH